MAICIRRGAVRRGSIYGFDFVTLALGLMGARSPCVWMCRRRRRGMPTSGVPLARPPAGQMQPAAREPHPCVEQVKATPAPVLAAPRSVNGPSRGENHADLPFMCNSASVLIGLEPGWPQRGFLSSLLPNEIALDAAVIHIRAARGAHLAPLPSLLC